MAGNGNSDRRLAALAAGRAKRAAQLAEKRASDLGIASSAPTRSHHKKADAPPAASSTSLSSDSSRSSSETERERERSDAQPEMIVGFDWDGAEPQASAASGAGDWLSSIFSVAASSGDAAPSPKATPLSKLDQDAARAANDYQALASGLFILLISQLVGADLKPSREQADEITAPLLRIAMRHFDAARMLSPDARDMLQSAGAFAMYLQAIYPYWQAKRAERKVRNVVTKQSQQSAVPTAAGGNGSDRGGADRDPGAGAARAGAPASTASGGAGSSQLAAAPDAGDHGAGNGRGHRLDDVAALFAEIGVGGL